MERYHQRYTNGNLYYTDYLQLRESHVKPPPTFNNLITPFGSPVSRGTETERREDGDKVTKDTAGFTACGVFFIFSLEKRKNICTFVASNDEGDN